MSIEETREYKVLVGHLADQTGRDVGTFSPDDATDDFDLVDWEFEELVELACEECGVEYPDLYDSSPEFPEQSDTVIWSLQFLAAFSDNARKGLAGFSRQAHVATLASAAESIRAGRYVESGRTRQVDYEPFSRAQVFVYLAVACFPMALSIWLSFGPCNPLCRTCPQDVRTQVEFLAVGGGLFLVVAAGFVLPGLRFLIRSERRDPG